MTRIDVSPLFRNTIGFERLSRMLDAAHNVNAAADSFPPYDIEKSGEDSYRISLAVAGFTMDELNVETRNSAVVVTGTKAQEKDDGRTVLHRGIDKHGFQRSFELADYVQVVGASLQNGLLHIELKRELPESMKPRTIEISGTKPKAIEGKAKAA